MITVENLIKDLEKVKDKSKPVLFSIFEDDAEYIKVYKLDFSGGRKYEIQY